MKFFNPVNRRHYGEASIGDVIADKTVGGIGTWTWIIGQTCATFVWMLLNTVIWLTGHWDPYPWILLNLMYSLQAGLTGPLILLSNKRSDAHARELAEYSAKSQVVSLAALAALLRSTPEDTQSIEVQLTDLIKEHTA